MSWPNRITVARILAIVPFVIAILRMNDEPYVPWARRVALLLFLTMAFADVLDGWLARRHNSATPLGRFLDPLADKLMVTAACILLSSGPTAVKGAQLPDVVLVLIISKELYTVLGFVIIYLVTSQVRIVPAATGRISTMVQMSMIVGILLWPDVQGVWGGFLCVVQSLWWSAAGMAIVTAVVYTRNGSRYLNTYEQHEKLLRHKTKGPPYQERKTGS